MENCKKLFETPFSTIFKKEKINTHLNTNMNGEGEYQDIRDRQIDSILEANQRRLGEWIEKNPQSKISQIPAELYLAFLPRRVYEVASDPGKVNTLPLQSDNRVWFLAREQDYYAEQLTDPKAWDEWQKTREEEAQKSTSGIRVLSGAPRTVNHFHAKYYKEVNAGRLMLTDRILMENHFGQEPASPEVLHTVFFDTERRQGIGKEFYQSTLPGVAKQFGIRFIVGNNNVANLSFFADAETGLGRSSLNQIKPEYRKQFFPNFSVDDPTRDYSQYTVQFLYPEDKKKYLI
ncbi:MAG: hypothetical protein M1333_00295 [Patescibacteria group bacterium]|nr:hypothetical protein [Patescibacteria group bacterium]